MSYPLREGFEARASHIPSLATPRPHPQCRLLFLPDRAGVDEILDLPEHEARLNLAVDGVPVVFKGDGLTCDEHAYHPLLGHAQWPLQRLLTTEGPALLACGGWQVRKLPDETVLT